ncbi:maleylpyruvate isomerase N-terminal domain-containing protein [Daejeonella sp.]|uniref:maleylpyruvate isomerase N-terminal domain-containing protein n=1 Tax=Daejeonella sp. TaxID=2805397 RepID=UPI002724AF3A|nr:maleylpyruvate isomerase N-terminal domain-containing protein [Daejeonella sp.]MDO8994546.1 maleylpyruvate isomerase N-terminal domain-containing protein [Daejeonella sp.]MDP2413280.1 maleylpyruvate isomerase N-terminal domain-containing protein [Daejeonella sp.]
MIDVLHLFPVLNSSLIEVLTGLERRQWNNDTLCKQWKVRDIAAHLLDGALRRLSIGRDAYQTEPPEIKSYQDLLNYLNALNADWVNAYKRVSPEIILEQLKLAQVQMLQYLESLDPDAKAIFSVSWAGEDVSTNRFDIAREYTERWHHQQQIRQAVGAKSIMDRELYNPFLQICMQALPYHYRSFESPDGTLIRVEVVGDAGGVWAIVRKGSKWEFSNEPGEIASQIYIDQNIAWMLFSKGIEINQAKQYWQVIGDQELGMHALAMPAFMV